MCHFFLTTRKSFVQCEWYLGIHDFKVNYVENTIDSVVGANDANILNDTWVEKESLPRTTVVQAVINDTNPVLAIHRDFDVVRIRPEMDNNEQ